MATAKRKKLTISALNKLWQVKYPKGYIYANGKAFPNRFTVCKDTEDEGKEYYALDLWELSVKIGIHTEEEMWELKGNKFTLCTKCDRKEVHFLYENKWTCRLCCHQIEEVN